jgi:transposase
LKPRSVLAFFQKLSPCLVGIEACASSHHWSARTPGTWPYRAINAAGLRKALRQTAEERHG